AVRGDSPARALTELNEFLARRSASDEFATIFLVAIHPDGRIEACDAGHGLAFMIGVHGARRVDSDGGPHVGAAAGIDFGASETVLERGDRLLLVTDGVHEQRSRDGDQFGLERIMGVLGAKRTGADDVGTLLAELSRFAGERFDDDVTILSITRS
ncbi:MAG: PP2C family protein-serine/threonine phosphatase, partial [Planctomycetota bacterium]